MLQGWLHRLHRPARDSRARPYRMAQGFPVWAIAALVVGIPWFGWRYTRPTWTRGRHRNGSAPQRSGRARQYVRHRYIYMRNRSDRGPSHHRRFLWSLSATASASSTTPRPRSLATRKSPPCRSVALHVFRSYPNAIAIGPSGSGRGGRWGDAFYGLFVVLWLGTSTPCSGCAMSAPLSDR